MYYNDIITSVSKELNLPYKVVDKVYKSYWKFIRDTIKELPLHTVKEEEFKDLKTNFNIPSLGKLTCSFNRLNKVRERYKHIKNLMERNDKNKEDETYVYSPSDNNGSI